MTAGEPDRRRWEERYTNRGDPPGAPSEFLLHHLALLPRGRALDLACGDGANAIALARHGFAVDAIDFAGAGLHRGMAAARRAGLRVGFVQADLQHYPLPVSRYAVVVIARYLQRSLWPAVADALRPGGVAVVETFLIDQRALGHPRNPNFLLQRGELRETFADFETLVDEEGLFRSGGGRAYLARIIARKRESPH